MFPSYRSYESARALTSTHLTHHLYAPYAPAHLRALPIINKRLTLLRPCASLPSPISALRAFFLSCVMLFQLKGKVPMFCVCAPINNSPPVSLLSFILQYKAVLLFFFILSHWLYHYLHNYFATTFPHFLFCFSFKINLTNIQFSYI